MTKDKREHAKLVIAISSGALFDLTEAFKIFKKNGVDAYANYQIKNESVPLEPGAAFYLVKKLLNLNKKYDNFAEVILLSRNSADTGLRVFNSIQHHGLNIERAAFTNGNTPYQYLKALGANLFLSAYSKDVKEAIDQGCPAATMFPSPNKYNSHDSQIRIAFDGDAVLFSDELERIYQEQGLEAASANEVKKVKTPLPSGPFFQFAKALNKSQECCNKNEFPIRTALVTARSAPSHERVIRTLRDWGIRIDEAFFLGGRPKGNVLEAFNADIFFDDQTSNCLNTKDYVPTGHVPYGIGAHSEDVVKPEDYNEPKE